MIELDRLVRHLGLFFARRSLPSYQGRRHVPGLREPATVVRDEHGIPHIYARNARDLFFAEGYIHAEERLFQMDMARRACRGRLAEVLGDDLIPWRESTIQFQGLTVPDLDLFFRTFGLEQAAERALSAVSGEAAEALDAYARGVTRFIEETFAPPPGERRARPRPIEMRLLDYVPEPWTPLDSLAVLKGLAFQLDVSWKMKLAILAAAARLGPGDPRLAEILPRAYEGNEPRVVHSNGAARAAAEGGAPEAAPGGERARLRGAGEAARGLLMASGQFCDFVGWSGAHVGSNNWVLGAKKTTTGAPILCNDPHLRLVTPSTWFLTHLVGGPYDVLGASAPGLPGVALGHGRRVAWGCTLAMVDDTDLYLEDLHPSNPALYRVADRFEPFAVRRETIKVREERDPRVRFVRSTRHGPILSDALPRHGPISPVLDPASWNADGRGAPLIALRWTAAVDPGDEVGALLGIARAEGWADFVQALRGVKAPAQNFVYADVDGHIGYYLAGSIPIREGGEPPLPVPADGARGEGEWKGFVPFEELPHLFDPPSGAISTANNQPVDDSYPHYISRFYEPRYRVERIRELLDAKERLSPEDAAAIQLDVRSRQARDLIEALLRPVEDRLKAEGGVDVAIALNHVLDWSCDCTADSIGAAIFHVFLHDLLEETFSDALGDDICTAFLESFSIHVPLVESVLTDPTSAWYAERDRDTLVCRTFKGAVERLMRDVGPIADLQWGRIHQVEMRHPFHTRPVLRRLFDIGPAPTGGSPVTVNNGTWIEAYPFAHVVGASYRQVIDLGALKRRYPTRLVIHGGQSGNPASPHYDDQARAWLAGELLEVHLLFEEVERRGRHLELWPAGTGANGAGA
jgi:penicillin amidase